VLNVQSHDRSSPPPYPYRPAASDFLLLAPTRAFLISPYTLDPAAQMYILCIDTHDIMLTSETMPPASRRAGEGWM